MGWQTGPLDYPPHRFLAWQGHFDDPRSNLEERHASLLARHGMRHLDLGQLRSTQRVVTQTVALELLR